MIVRTLELYLFDRCEPFHPKFWWRFVSFTEPNKLWVDSQIEIPDSEPVGFVACVDTAKKVPTVLDPNSFMPRMTCQSVKLLWREEWWNAGIIGLNYPMEAQQDLRSVHSLDAEKELAEIYSMDAEDWLNGIRP